jgi:hypothetical protein
VYIVTIAITLFFNYLGRQSMVVDAAIYLALFVTIGSGLHYIAHAARSLNRH